MSFTSPTSLELCSNEKQWAVQIRSFFNENQEDCMGMPVSIFMVPKTLSKINPEAYTPQLIALGPYHHWREDLGEMERYKLVAAKRVQSQFPKRKFQDYVDKLMKAEHKIRACYHKYLKITGETLALMMAIDGLFLLEFLQVYVNKDIIIMSSTDLDSSPNRIFEMLGKKLTYDSIVKDMMMLENQIPIFVLKRIIRVQLESTELSYNWLPPLLLGVCKEISPLMLKGDYPFPQVIKHAHLLDLLYHLIVPVCAEEAAGGDHPKDKERLMQNDSTEAFMDVKHQDSVVVERFKAIFSVLWDKISRMNISILRKIKNGPLNIIRSIPWHVIAPSLGISSDDQSSDDQAKKIPSVQEIVIPSVSELSDAGVEFVQTKGDITTIKFDEKCRKFYLPVVHLDVNSEVILRNLVAYEASAISGPLVLARYTELMNGIVDTGNDVKILRKKNIIVNRLKNNKEVADLWNGMSRSIRLTHVPYIDKAIEEVNAYFYSTRKYKMYKMMKTYVYGSWRVLVIFATLLLLGLMCLQSFCTVYSCPRMFHLEDAA